MRAIRVSMLFAVGLMFFGCATAPSTASEQQALVQRAQATVQTMVARDPSLRPVLDSATGYAVFPDIGKAGFIAGGAHGKGVLFERGQVTGFTSLTQGSVGAQIGAQSFAQLVVFRDPNALARLKLGQFSLAANASAVAITAGAGAGAEFRSGVAVFVMPRGGAMAELSVGGQQINFQPAG